jgi:photosystem II stability/assembly factor-like uncharacterized protein
MISWLQNNLIHFSFRLFYKRFTSLLQVFTIKKPQGCWRQIPLLYCFTKLNKVMKIINHLPFLLYIPVISGLCFQFLFASEQSSELSHASAFSDSQQVKKSDKAATVNIVFKSADGGKTWQNMSEGLPKPVEDDYSVGRNVFTADKALFLTAGNGIYHCNTNATTAVWKKEIFPNKMNNIATAKNRILAYNYGGQIVQKTNGTNRWLPVYSSFKGTINTVFETAFGSVFIGSENGLFKSSNGGKTWKHVHMGGWVMKLAEQNGVLLATCMSGIIRSTDNGENWAVVISEGGVGIDVEPINGGFAAIAYNTELKTRRIKTSYDAGKTWQAIDAGLPPSDIISSIIQVGENLFCGHPDGIYQSSNKGKTWKRILCSMDGKVYNLSVSGSTIYAVLRNGGC